MSSLAAARADNFYYPPDWTPKQGGLNKYHNSHPLGDRARKIKDGILIVRFEMMYNCWCEGCKKHVGKGVRFNAEKKAVGKYHSTTVWEFRMKCPACSQRFVIRTDPEHRDYEFVSGAKRKLEAFEAEDNETIKLLDDETKHKMLTDPILRMEHDEQDKQRAAAAAPRLVRLQQVCDSLHERDADLNATLRKHFRTAKKELRKRERESDAKGLGVTLLPEEATDAEQARKVMRRYALGAHAEQARRADAKLRRLAMRAQPVLPGAPSSSAAAARRMATIRRLQGNATRTRALRLASPARAPAGDFGGIFPASSRPGSGGAAASAAVTRARLKPRAASGNAT